MKTEAQIIEATLSSLKPSDTVAWHCTSAGELTFARLGALPVDHYQISYPAAPLADALKEKAIPTEWVELFRRFDAYPPITLMAALVVREGS